MDLLPPLKLTIRIRLGMETLPVVSADSVFTVSRLPSVTILLNGILELTTCRTPCVLELTD